MTNQTEWTYQQCVQTVAELQYTLGLTKKSFSSHVYTNTYIYIFSCCCKTWLNSSTYHYTVLPLIKCCRSLTNMNWIFSFDTSLHLHFSITIYIINMLLCSIIHLMQLLLCSSWRNHYCNIKGYEWTLKHNVSSLCWLQNNKDVFMLHNISRYNWVRDVLISWMYKYNDVTNSSHGLLVTSSLHGVTTQLTTTWIITVKTSNLTSFYKMFPKWFDFNSSCLQSMVMQCTQAIMPWIFVP
jgi:hypothetical protein